MRAQGFRFTMIGTDMLAWAVAHWRAGMAYTKELYPLVGKAFRVSAASAERDMRYALQRAWAQPEPDYYDYYDGKGGEPCPTLSEYIARTARDMRWWEDANAD